MVDRKQLASGQASDDVVAKLRAQGFEPLGGPPDAFAQFIAREMVKWAAAAEAAGMREQQAPPPT